MSMQYFSHRRVVEVASHPDFVSGLLEPLSRTPGIHRPLATSALMPVADASGEAEVEVLFNDLASNIADVLEANARVVRTSAEPGSPAQGSRADGRPCRRSIPVRNRTRRSASSRTVARLLTGGSCHPVSATSHMTRTPLVRADRGNGVGLSTKQELRPSACSVEEPSKPQSCGSCSSVGRYRILICVFLPRCSSAQACSRQARCTRAYTWSCANHAPVNAMPS